MREKDLKKGTVAMVIFLIMNFFQNVKVKSWERNTAFKPAHSGKSRGFKSRCFQCNHARIARPVCICRNFSVVCQ